MQTVNGRTPVFRHDRGGVESIANILAKGGIAAIPTETVYGLAARADSETAVERVFAAKGRPSDNPLIVHVPDIDTARSIAEFDDRAGRLLNRFSPGPITLVLPYRTDVATAARAGLRSVALRIPDSESTLEILALTGPLVAPSANKSGRPSPTTAGHVLDDLDGSIDAILDAGPCTIGIESTIVSLIGKEPKVLRPGSIGVEEIEEVLKRSVRRPIPNQHDAVVTPGTRYRHYAPEIPIEVLESIRLDPTVDAVRSGIVSIASRVSRLLVPEDLVDQVADLPGVITDIRALTAHTFYEELRRAEFDGVERLGILLDRSRTSAGLADRIRRSAGIDAQ